MGLRQFTSIVCALLIVLGSFSPSAAQGEQPAREAPRVNSPPALDVKLTAEGSVNGVLVDADGSPLAKARLTAVRADHRPVTAETNHQGEFCLTQLRPGVYTVAYGDRSLLLRAWEASSAPPSAKEAVLLVNGNIERGQLGDLNPLAGSFTAQTFAVGVLASAVVVPLAIGFNNDDPSGS